LGAGTVFAVDPRPESRALAMRLGADAAFADIARITQSIDADVVFDFVGSSATTEAAAKLLGPGARLVTVGSGGGRLTVGKDL
ncbi:zinc-binding dehydrogenase, partial [Escherichia coli]|nr:zinc-binding dehydrogenase [Escherichia coli]